MEEVSRLLQKRMKLKKSAGPDDHTAEHLRYWDHTIVIWLTELLNSIIELEQIPTVLKSGVTILVYKGGGKHPLDVNSYRGITFNFVINP